MQQIANLPLNAHAGLPSKANSVTAPPLSSTATRTLWVRMAEIYGHRWTSAYGAESGADGAAGTWAKGLAGVTPVQVADGLNACLASADPWPPTLPEFRAMCLSIPTLALVRLEIRSGEHSQFTRAVWGNLDAYRFRQASAEAADRMLREAYDLTREEVMRGQPLPEPSEAITHEKPEFKPASPEVAEAAMQRIRESLGVGAMDAEQEPVIDRKTAAAGGDA